MKKVVSRHVDEEGRISRRRRRTTYLTVYWLRTGRINTEIRRSLSLRRDTNFFTRAARYDLLHQRDEIRPSSSARQDASFFVRTKVNIPAVIFPVESIPVSEFSRKIFLLLWLNSREVNPTNDSDRVQAPVLGAGSMDFGGSYKHYAVIEANAIADENNNFSDARMESEDIATTPTEYSTPGKISREQRRRKMSC